MPMKKSALLFCMFFSLAAPVAWSQIRTWTNLSGKTLQAEMVGIDVPSRAVRLRNVDGQVFDIPIGNLSAEDVAYAGLQWRQMQAAGTTLPAASASGTTGATPALSPQGKVVGAPPRYASRCSEAARMGLVLENGGSMESEAAVTRSLEWLKTQQNPDGSWGKRSACAFTAFVLQCYTGRCHGPYSPLFGDQVTKGALYLLEQAGKNPYGMVVEDVKTADATYTHAIATYALGEILVLSRGTGRAIPELQPAFEKAVKLIIDHQNPRGSWNYGGVEAGFPLSYNKNSKGEDLSLANWHFQALMVARESGLAFAGLNTCIEKSVTYIQKKQTKAGGFGLENRDMHYNQWYLSGGAVYGLQTLGDGKSADASQGIKFLRKYLTAEPLGWSTNCNLYSWVSNTQAYYHAGGDDWKFYVAALLPEILSAQQPDGSFKAGRPNWPAAAAADPIYRQALCTLQLEVFYRNAK